MAGERLERKLAAILAADVAGYSRLMGEDEEATLTALRAHRHELLDPQIAEHRGRIANTAGDSLLVEFASVVDAVRCAVAIQQGMARRNAELPEPRRLVFRMGINLGDVMVQGQDLLGDGVNVAARLEQISQPGSVYISRMVHDQVQGKLPLTFEALGPQQVKNIAQPVETWRMRWEGEAADPLQPSPKPAGTVRLSIAVLPFQNMSGNPDQEYYADGLTEDLITDLSRIQGAQMIARNSAFSYKGCAVDVRQVARELNVRYLLEGSVRRQDRQVRVNVQLVDGESGAHIWADRFDRKLEDVFSLQDEVTGRLANTLRMSLLDVESRRSREGKPGNLDAQDYAFRAFSELYNRGMSPESFGAALEWVNKALALDPNNADA